MTTIGYTAGDRRIPMNISFINFTFIQFLSHKVNVIDLKFTSYRYIPVTDGITCLVHIL